MSKARNNRKKERKQLDEFIPEMAEDGEYYSCTNTQEHAESCNEIDESHKAWEFGFKRIYLRNGKEIACETVTKWDVGIFLERERWKKLGVDPAGYQTDIMILEVKIGTILDVIEELDLIPQNRLNEIYQMRLYHTLKNARELLEP